MTLNGGDPLVAGLPFTTPIVSILTFMSRIDCLSGRPGCRDGLAVVQRGEDVRGLQVAVDDALGVGVLDG
jgi:hypothetical protein